MEDADIDRRFTYYPPRGGQPNGYQAIRSFARSFAHLINDLCPDGREKSTAVSRVEEAVMWANAAIARQEWCDVDDLPAAICGGPHRSHVCRDDALVVSRADNTDPCPFCGQLATGEHP